VDGLDVTFTTYLCFSDYRLFFPGIERMTGCAQFAVGFANNESTGLGTSDEARAGYQIIGKFRDLPARPALGLGFVDIHTDFVEPPELIRDRILYAVKVFGGPERLQVMPDCALRTRSWDIAYRKLTSMVAGTRLARVAIGW
jgi:5-methyltetrahydropteroyltriglutamate--homocysteine methyltransferase